MLSPDRRRHRARRSTTIWLVVGALVLVVLIGGVLRISRVSGPYWRSVDRSYAAQGAVLVDRSNRSAAQLTEALEAMPGASRTAVRAELDLLVTTTAETARAAGALAPPAPWGDVASGFAAVLSQRAEAVSRLRGAVDGLLGLTDAGSTAGAGGDRSTGEVTSELSSVGDLLERSDRSYADLRRQFLRAPGRPRLPASQWVPRPARWSAGAVAAVVSQLQTSSTLAPVHDVVLVPNAISVAPAAVPQGPTEAGATSMIQPTHSVAVTAVVANDGNVAEPALVVSAGVTPLTGGPTVRRSTRVSVAPGASAAVELPRIPVRPGRTYDLTVAVRTPSGAGGGDTSATFAVEVAPAVSPPPSTTTTTTTTTPHHATTTTGHATTTTGHATTTTGHATTTTGHPTTTTARPAARRRPSR